MWQIFITTCFIAVSIILTAILSVGSPVYEVIAIDIPKPVLEAQNSPLVPLCEQSYALCNTKITNSINAIIYGYSSEVNQTDSTPFITANGTRVRRGIIANNCLPFGTKTKVNNEIFEVQDRMNSRYGCEVFDIWFESREEALNWGKRELLINVME